MKIFKNTATLFIVFGLGFFSTISYAQSYGQTSFSVNINGKNLSFPFTGGMNCPQFSEADFNQDGVADLFIFDRIGNKVLTFINKGTPNSIDYEYSPNFAQYFPTLNEWALLRDYDGDGIMDIFGYYDLGIADGIMVYKGFYENKILKFKRFNFHGYKHNIIPFLPQVGQPLTNLYVSGQDIPDINDVDGDGDLDIVTFAQGGGKVELYKNNSIEKGWKKDSLQFDLVDHCWGKFYESGITKALDLSTKPGECFLTQPVSTPRHAGSTVLTYDMDNDGDVEVLLGDISFRNINLAINGGTKNNAYMTSQVTNFPAEATQPVDMEIFPASFMLDLNNDGKKDYIAAPNFPNVAEDQNTAWFYENIGTSKIPKFQFVQKNLLSDQMLDFGSYSVPTVGDLTGDGLDDIVIGIGNRFINVTQQESRLIFFKNVGTAGKPAFELADDNWLNFKDFSNSTYYFAPHLGDMDNDGDLDLLVGEYNGKMFYAQNTAGKGNPATFATPIYDAFKIDVGLQSTPFIVDLNNDGLNDLVIGERNGNLNFCPNIGTATNPKFEVGDKDSPIMQSFGGIKTFPAPYTTGNSAPFILKLADKFIVLSGSELGNIYQYEGKYNDLSGTFVQKNIIPNLDKINEGRFTNLVLSTFQGNQYFAIVGNARGGLSAFHLNFDSNGNSVATNNPITSEENIKIYPNPASTYLTIEMQNSDEVIQKVVLYNMFGQMVITSKSKPQYIDVQSLSNGFYTIVIQTNSQHIIKKVLIER